MTSKLTEKMLKYNYYPFARYYLIMRTKAAKLDPKMFKFFRDTAKEIKLNQIYGIGPSSAEYAKYSKQFLSEVLNVKWLHDTTGVPYYLRTQYMVAAFAFLNFRGLSAEEAAFKAAYRLRWIFNFGRWHHPVDEMTEDHFLNVWLHPSGRKADRGADIFLAVEFLKQLGFKGKAHDKELHDNVAGVLKKTERDMKSKKLNERGYREWIKNELRLME